AAGGEPPVLVLPPAAQGFSRRVAQAQAAGVRVVAEAAGGVAEQVIHGVNGFLVAPADPLGVAEAVQEAQAAQAGSRAWAGPLLAPALRAQAAAASVKLRELCRLLAAAEEPEPGLALEYADWLEARPLQRAALVEGLRQPEAVRDPALAARLRAQSRQRRLELNHAIAFFRARGCEQVAFAPGAPEPGVQAWLETWGLPPAAAPAWADGVLWDAPELPELGALRRRHPGARALVTVSAGEVETFAWPQD
ncbi:MAG: glycosyltransferase, partial [Terriglobales bacterium]